MTAFLDFIPLVIFFFVYKTHGTMPATAALMAATVLQMLFSFFLQNRKLEKMQWFMLLSVLIFGAITLMTQNESFIQWKFTLMQSLMAAVLAIGLWGFKKNLLQSILGDKLQLPDSVWRQLVFVWIGYFIFRAILNSFVVMNYSFDQWMSFKIWSWPLVLIFVVIQGVIVAKHLPKESA